MSIVKQFEKDDLLNEFFKKRPGKVNLRFY